MAYTRDKLSTCGARMTASMGTVAEQDAHGPVLSLRERKKLQVRRNLIDTALRLFRANGFQQTTLEQLVDAAEVSTRTLFRYFPSKEAIAMAAEDELWDAFYARVIACELDGPVLDSLRGALLDSLAGMDTGWEQRFLATRGLAARTPELRDYSALQTIKTQIRVTEALESRLNLDSREHVELRLVPEMAMSAWRCAAKNWIRASRHQTKPRPRDSLIALLVEAFEAIPRSLTFAAHPDDVQQARAGARRRTATRPSEHAGA